MIRFEDWWLPEGEEHLQQYMLKVNKSVGGRLSYQRHKYELALRYTKLRRVALDIGAHIGLWSYQMTQDFMRVIAFEPVKEFRDCWRHNMEGKNVTLFHYALGHKEGFVRMRVRPPGSPGDDGRDPAAERSSLRMSVDDVGELVEMRTLDPFKFDHIDLLKLDCEGYELFILKGGIDTLLRNRPCVIVEQKPATGMTERYNVAALGAVEFLQKLGAKKRGSVQGDHVLSWD